MKPTSIPSGMSTDRKMALSRWRESRLERWVNLATVRNFPKK
jgi:hypothetical protein